MLLTPIQADILRATRPDVIDVYVLRERFGDNYSATLSMLIKNKLVQKTGEDSVKITALGRAVCPPRSTKVVKRNVVKRIKYALSV